VPFVTQDAHNLGRQSFVQNSNYLFAVCLVTFRHGTALYVLSRTISQRFDIR
jgi:hypothetical protein